MIISTCPRCHEGFRVPSGPIPKDALAHCPWCHETFPITDILEKLPPQLEIVSADGRPLVIGESSSVVSSGLQLVDSSERPASFGTLVEHEMRDDDPHRTIANEDFDETIVDESWHHDITVAGSAGDKRSRLDDDPYGTLDGTETSPLHSMNVSTKSSSRKRKGSGMGTFLGIVLGGLASVPIAGGLLALMGRTPDWGFWPFQGEVATGAVRAAAPLDQSDRSDNSPMPTGTSLRFNQDRPDAVASSDPADSAAQEIMSSVSSTPTEPPTRMTISDQATNRPTARKERDPSEEVTPPVESASSQSTDVPSTDVTSTDTQPAETQSSGPTLAGEPASAADQQAISALQMLDSMSQEQGDESERRRRLGRTYQAIASAAALADEPGEYLSELAAKVAASPLRDEIASAGWVWLAFKNRKSDGIALIGVADVSDQGAFLTSESGETIELISDREIADGEHLLLLGRLVEQGKSLQVVHSEPIP